MTYPMYILFIRIIKVFFFLLGTLRTSVRGLAEDGSRVSREDRHSRSDDRSRVSDERSRVSDERSRVSDDRARVSDERARLDEALRTGRLDQGCHLDKKNHTNILKNMDKTIFFTKEKIYEKNMNPLRSY